MINNKTSNKLNEDLHDLDLIDLIKELWKSKLFIIILSLIFSVSSLIYAVNLPNIYTSSALLEVTKDPSDQSSSIGSQYGGLASLAGISLPDSTNDRGHFVVELVKSKNFLKHLLEFPEVKINLMASKSYDEESASIIYDPEIYNISNNKWVRVPPKGRKVIPSFLEVHKDAYINDISISKDKKSGFISIKYEHISPKFAFTMLDLIIKEVNSLTRKKDLENSSESLEYLLKQSNLTTQNEIKNLIDELMGAQMKKQMLSRLNEDYLLQPLDSPVIPELKSSPSRAIIVIISSLIGFIISILFIISRFLIKRSIAT